MLYITFTEAELGIKMILLSQLYHMAGLIANIQAILFLMQHLIKQGATRGCLILTYTQPDTQFCNQILWAGYIQSKWLYSSQQKRHIHAVYICCIYIFQTQNKSPPFRKKNLFRNALSEE